MALTWDPYEHYRGIAVCAALTSAATLFVLLRFWTRIRQPDAKLRWDDWLLLVDLPILWSQSGLMIWIYRRQLSRTSRELSDADIKLALKCLFAYYHLFNWGISLVKLSVLCFYVRVFSVEPTLSKCIKSVGALVTLWPLVFTLSAFGECRPLAKAWDPWVAGTCFDIKAWWLANGISDTVIDLVILILPMPTLWKMQLRLSQKVLVSLVFLAGYSLAAASLRRTIAFVQFHKDWNGYERIDISDQIFPPLHSFWPIYETPWGIISACLPCVYSFTRLIWTYGPRAVLSLVSLRSQPTSQERSTAALVAENRGQDAHELPELAAPKHNGIEDHREGDSASSLSYDTRL